MSNLFLAVLVFLCTTTSDFIWAKYIKAVNDKKALVAAGWSASIILIGGITIVSYVEVHWLVVPAALGAFLGTFLSVRKSK